MDHRVFFFLRTPRAEWTRELWQEEALLWAVFAITGSSASKMAKVVVQEGFKQDGSLWEGPWSYRLTYFCTTLPIYSTTLVAVGTAARRGAYFQKFAWRMWSRMIPGGLGGR